MAFDFNSYTLHNLNVLRNNTKGNEDELNKVNKEKRHRYVVK